MAPPGKQYTPPPFLFNGHLETIYPALFRKVALKPYQRERISTPDADFLDLDWLTQGSDSLVIISHGLEGDTQRPYIKGMAAAMASKGLDVLTWNYRGCSGEMNRQLRFYHSGATDDLDLVIQHATARGNYTNLYLIGFSLGGNITLKYLGERQPLPILRKAVAFSVPLDLYASSVKISQPGNRIYARRFLNSLRNKVIRKHAAYPTLDITDIQKIATLEQFDDRYTAPLHGFANALTYYRQCSAIGFLDTIRIPTLIVNAKNDPFLSPECYPAEQLKNHPFVVLETPVRGGHVGFSQFRATRYWSEERALAFLLS